MKIQKNPDKFFSKLQESPKNPLNVWKIHQYSKESWKILKNLRNVQDIQKNPEKWCKKPKESPKNPRNV